MGWRCTARPNWHQGFLHFLTLTSGLCRAVKWCRPNMAISTASTRFPCAAMLRAICASGFLKVFSNAIMTKPLRSIPCLPKKCSRPPTAAPLPSRSIRRQNFQTAHPLRQMTSPLAGKPCATRAAPTTVIIMGGWRISRARPKPALAFILTPKPRTAKWRSLSGLCRCCRNTFMEPATYRPQRWIFQLGRGRMSSRK